MPKMVIEFVSHFLVRSLIIKVSKVREELEGCHVIHMAVMPGQHLVYRFKKLCQSRIDQRLLG